MKGDPIPEEDSLALHCQPNTGMEIDEHGNPSGITREAFRVDDDGISTNWVEYEGGDLQSACFLLASVRVARKGHRVGIFKVKEAIDTGKEHGKVVAVIQDPIDDPDKPNPAHALVTGVIAADTDLLDHLALLVVLELFSDTAIAHSKSVLRR